MRSSASEAGAAGRTWLDPPTYGAPHPRMSRSPTHGTYESEVAPAPNGMWVDTARARAAPQACLTS